MSLLLTEWTGTPIVVRCAPSFAGISRDEFFEFCQANAPYQIEKTAAGEINIMTPSGGETGRKKVSRRSSTRSMGREGLNGCRLQFVDRVLAAQWRNALSGCFLGQA
jgi:hypothetical protein